MGYGCRHNNSIVIERQDMDGICNVLARRAHDAERQEDSFFYMGAFAALDMLRLHEFRDQAEYFEIFDALNVRRDYGED